MNQREQRPYCGGFSGAVGSDKAENFTFRDFKGDILDSAMLSVILCQAFCFDCVHTSFRLSAIIIYT
ncbi:hypothetical protein SDC9_168715 [bioreactor metagenome]|uniref:Uncharacterized protein n=1 Tax=bioreactor metagenome TaxID=1076179 RepID=A0A645G5D1_9ZZZZ